MFNRNEPGGLTDRIPSCAFCIIFFCITLSGCKLNVTGSTQSWWKKPICTLPSSPTKEDVIDRINEQVKKIDSWQCENAKIKFKGGPLGIPVGLNANIAVEKPLNFRMTISHAITSREGDLGSNGEQFWFWVRRSEPKYLFTCAHQDIDIAREKLQIPFQINWLMEVLGVVSLNADDFILQIPETRNGILSLVSTSTGEDGRSFKRVILVDACYGRIIAHELRDSNDNIIAHADLNNYRKIKKAGVSLPHQFDLILYQPTGTRMELQISLKRISVNPEKRFLAKQWVKPHYNGYPEFNIGQNFRHEFQNVNSSKSAGIEQQPQQTNPHHPKTTMNMEESVRPAWIEKGKTEFILPDIHAFQEERKGQTQQVSSEIIFPDEQANEEEDVLLISDEEPDWSE